MVARSSAPPTPWSKNLAQPQIHETAYVHSFSNIIGEVYVGANVLVAPGTSIRADEGSPFYIGEGSSVQDGVVIHGLEAGRVLGDDQKNYSVWIGKNTSVAHMALIHGPAYIGDDCFVGFRTTIFNARVGKGCIVMMHALIQDVEIPPGKYVASGSIVTTQQQADRLPNVQPKDVLFVSHVVGINDALRAGVHRVEDLHPVAAVQRESASTSIKLGGDGVGSFNNDESQVGSMRLNPEVVEQVQQLLAQGYQVGTEYADKRRFQTSSWQSGGVIASVRTSDAIAALEASLADHPGEYVRMIGVDTQSKRRVAEVIVQRPGDNGSATSPSNSYSYTAPSRSNPSSSYGSPASGSLSADVVEQVRQLLAQGCRIGSEHADARRFQTSSWRSCAPIQSTRINDVLAALEACMAEHAGEYVRLIGIDPGAKKRVAEVVIQRPGESRASSNGNGGGYSPSRSAASSGSYAPTGGGLSSQVVEQVRQLLAQGHLIGTEHADARRFRTSSWQSCAPIQSTRINEVISALEACLAEHRGEYVQLIGIDSSAKKRIVEIIIQRPGDSGQSNGTSAGFSASYSAPASGGTSSKAEYFVPGGSRRLSPEVIDQVHRLLAQGYRIGTEHADARRFRTSSWQSCAPIQSSRATDVIGALEACLAEHAGEYVRLIGIDPGAKKRVAETMLQRP